MTSVRYLYTSQPGRGFTELNNPESPLKNWLKVSLRQPHSPSYTRTLDKGLSVTLQDGWVICTYLTRRMDDNNRPFIRNHSVLVPEDDYNGLARDFDRTILENIEQGDEDALNDGRLKPLGIPEVDKSGLQGKDLETLANYFGPDLEKLLASLISGKPISVRIRGATEDAIALTSTVLKTAALGNLPVPNVSTYEPSPKTRTWFPSQVTSSPQARAAFHFQQKSLPNAASANLARRLVQSVANYDPGGIPTSLQTASNHAEVASQYPSAVSPTVTTDARKADAPSSSGNQTQIYQYNKEYEAALNKRKEDLDSQQELLNQQKRELLAREKDLRYRMEEELDEQRRVLQQQAQQLSAREGEVSRREEDVSEAEAHVKWKGARHDQWQHIEEIFSVLYSNCCQEPEDLVLSRFFDQLKGLERDTLQVLNEGVKDFVPNLNRIAELNASKKGVFLKDLEEIEKKLDGKNSWWRRT